MLVGILQAGRPVYGFVPPGSMTFHKLARYAESSLFSENNDDAKKDEPWDANVDYDMEWPKDQAPPDPSTAWDALPIMPEAPRLGIDVSLEPLNEQQAAEIKQEAEKIINSRIDEGIEDIEKLRKKMAKEMQSSKKIMQIASELDAKEKSDKLMKKIDQLTGSFLESTKGTRMSTKTAAAASRAMEGTNQGLEIGTWGTLSGRTVIASDIGSLLGSVDNAAQQQVKLAPDDTASSETAVAVPVENRIIMIADTNQVRIYRKR